MKFSLTSMIFDSVCHQCEMCITVEKRLNCLSRLWNCLAWFCQVSGFLFTLVSFYRCANNLGYTNNSFKPLNLLYRVYILVFSAERQSQQAMSSSKKGLYRFLTWWHCLLTLHVDLQCRHCETLIVVLYKCSKQHFVTHPIHGGDTGCFF